MVGLYPSLSHQTVLETLRAALSKRITRINTDKV